MSRFQLLSDVQWTLIEDLMPAPTGSGAGLPGCRQVVEGIIRLGRDRLAGCSEVFGPWQTIWTWHRRMSADGTGCGVGHCSAAEAAGGIDWAVAVDSTIARAHQHATNLTRHTGGCDYTNLRLEPPDHGIGRSAELTGKIHHLVDGAGRPLVVLVSAGQSTTAGLYPSAGAPAGRVPRGRARPARAGTR